MLVALGYDFMAAKGGREALDLFKAGFDLVLTDINMHGMDGWQLSLHLKDIKPNIPIVAIAGENPNNILAKLQDSPISQALFKPFSIVLLKNTLKQVFKQKEGLVPTSDI